MLENLAAPASAANENDLKTSVDLTTQTQLPVPEPAAGCETHPSAPQTKTLCVSKDKDGNLKIVPSGSQPTPASDIDLSLIPPPSDFMDLPGPPPEPEEAKAPPPSEVISTGKPGATIDLELLRQRASTKVSPPVTPEPLNNPPDLSPTGVSPHSSPPPESIEPRSPPAVAPKPKKLPANIILKSHKAAASDSSSGHSVPTCSDRILLDPQRVRIEALRKLGLLKSEEADSGPILSPKLSPQSRRSWAAPSPPISPAPHTPPRTPSYSRVSTPSSASNPPQSPVTVSPSVPSTPPAVDLPHIVPAPPAFSDPDGPLLSDIELSAVKDISGAADTAQVSTPPRTPPNMIKHLTPPKDKGFKSSTLEPSSLGSSSSMAVQDGSNKQSLSQLRNSRPRPASLGSGKEFSGTQGEGSQAGHASSREPDLRRSVPVPQHSGDSQKLPRSQGISVLICPRSENGDERREALRRLGLLRDWAADDRTCVDSLQMLYFKIYTDEDVKKLLRGNLTTHAPYALLFTALSYCLTLLEYVDYHSHTSTFTSENCWTYMDPFILSFLFANEELWRGNDKFIVLKSDLWPVCSSLSACFLHQHQCKACRERSLLSMIHTGFLKSLGILFLALLTAGTVSKCWLAF